MKLILVTLVLALTVAACGTPVKCPGASKDCPALDEGLGAGSAE